MELKQRIYCGRCCDRFETDDYERVKFSKPRMQTYAFKAVCPVCGLVCHKFAGGSKYQGGTTPHRFVQAKHKAKKKQREFYDAIENMPKLRAVITPEDSE